MTKLKTNADRTLAGGILVIGAVCASLGIASAAPSEPAPVETATVTEIGSTGTTDFSIGGTRVSVGEIRE